MDSKGDGLRLGGSGPGQRSPWVVHWFVGEGVLSASADHGLELHGQGVQFSGLSVHLPGSGGGLFGGSSVVLGELIETSDGETDLFDAAVEGLESARIGIPGKPAPDIFLEAARRLGVEHLMRLTAVNLSECNTSENSIGKGRVQTYDVLVCDLTHLIRLK